MSGSPLQTEFEFTLPQGYVDEEGTLHKDGLMRLATAADEIEPLQDPRVQSNSSYLTIILLSRVVSQLGDLDSVTTNVVENLFVGDLEHLQAMYERVNGQGTNAVETACPDCGEQFQVSVYDGAPLQVPHDDGGSDGGMDRRELDLTAAQTPERGGDQLEPPDDLGGGSGNPME